jgi:DNA repair protein RadC
MTSAAAEEFSRSSKAPQAPQAPQAPCDHDCPDGTCQPFTTLVRDEAKFAACMARAKQIGELDSAKAIYELVRGDMASKDQEEFIVICVDFRGQLRHYAIVGRGQRHRVATDIEDIIRPVILSGCDGAIVCHQHPSGIAEPSDADGDLTKAIKDGMAVACPTIKFLDHIVCGISQFYSFAENNWKVSGKVTKVT